MKYWEWGNLGTSVYYRHTTDYITRIQTQDVETQTTIRRPENIGTEDNFGLEFVFAYTGIKWLRVDGNINGFKFDASGVSSEGEVLSVNNYAWTSGLNAKVSFWKNADLQLRLNYRAPRKSVQGDRASITSLNVGFSKDLTRDLTLSFSLRDAFNNRRWRFTLENERIYEERDFQWRPRSLTATINYRINKKKERPKRVREGGEGEF